MGADILSRRKELALKLLKELKDDYRGIDNSADLAAMNSICCYDQAVDEMKTELQSILDEYNKNIEMIREINKKITSAVNNWYDYLKNDKYSSMLVFPLVFYFKKKNLYKEIESLNKQISEITINNRFLKEKLTSAVLELETRAVCLAHKGESYNEYEKLIQRRKNIESELKYLLPIISGFCPADITLKGIDSTIAAVEKLLQPIS